MILEFCKMTFRPLEAFRVLECARYRERGQRQSRSLVDLPSHIRVQLRRELQREFLQTLLNLSLFDNNLNTVAVLECRSSSFSNFVLSLFFLSYFINVFHKLILNFSLFCYRRKLVFFFFLKEFYSNIHRFSIYSLIRE